MSFLDDAMKGIGEAITAPKPAKTPEKTGGEPIEPFIAKPFDALTKLGETVAKNPQAVLSELGTAYCVTQRQDLYYGAMGLGAGLGFIATLVFVLIVRGKAK